jgi:hypothetical protein
MTRFQLEIKAERCDGKRLNYSGAFESEHDSVGDAMDDAPAELDELLGDWDAEDVEFLAFSMRRLG